MFLKTGWMSRNWRGDFPLWWGGVLENWDKDWSLWFTHTSKERAAISTLQAALRMPQASPQWNQVPRLLEGSEDTLPSLMLPILTSFPAHWIGCHHSRGCQYPASSLWLMVMSPKGTQPEDGKVPGKGNIFAPWPSHHHPLQKNNTHSCPVLQPLQPNWK